VFNTDLDKLILVDPFCSLLKLRRNILPIQSQAQPLLFVNGLIHFF